jgi:hypothetical protein
MTRKPFAKLDPAVESRRQRTTLFHTVPRLLNRQLEPVLGARRFVLVARLLLLAPLYARRFARPGDDASLREVKKRFLLVGALHQELLRCIGATQAALLTRQFLFELACAVQRQAYFPPRGEARNWEAFHREHEAQMEEGFIATNESAVAARTRDTVALHVTRCRFHECFRDMGDATLTEAFCRSDETVFNEYSPSMRFHRGTQAPDTIARGAARCTFIFERVPQAVQQSSGRAAFHPHPTRSHDAMNAQKTLTSRVSIHLVAAAIVAVTAAAWHPESRAQAEPPPAPWA